MKDQSESEILLRTHTDIFRFLQDDSTAAIFENVFGGKEHLNFPPLQAGMDHPISHTRGK